MGARRPLTALVIAIMSLVALLIGFGLPAEAQQPDRLAFPIERDQAGATRNPVPRTGSLVDRDELTAALDTGPAHGTLALSSDGGFVYTPTTDFRGQDSFRYHAYDGEASSDPVAVDLLVQEGGPYRTYLPVLNKAPSGQAKAARHVVMKLVPH